MIPIIKVEIPKIKAPGLKNIGIRNLADIGLTDIDVYGIKKINYSSLQFMGNYVKTKDIFIYKMIDPNVLASNKNVLKTLFYKTLGVADDDKKMLDVDTISGWITYKNHEYLTREWHSGAGYTSEKINEIAQKFFSKLMETNLNYTKNNPAVPVLFQSVPKLLEIIPFYEGKTVPTRWIARYNVYLDYTERERNVNVPVKDSLIEFVIDGYGAINAILMRWRPIERKTKVKLKLDKEVEQKQREYLSGFIQKNEMGANRFFDLSDLVCNVYKPEEEDHHHDSDEEETTTIEYYLGGNNTFQSHITPYLIHQSGHHAEKIEIIESCLNISFSITSSEQETTVEAVVNGSEENKSYSYSWAAWELSNPENHISLGNGNSCFLKGGVFQVLLTVKNNATGQTEQHQEHVYSTEPIQQQFEIQERWDTWGCTDPTALNYNPSANCDDGSCTY